jgi:hypothetical protein
LSRRIAATDAEIDQLVYELYGLTDDEIRIVEQSTSNAAAGWIKPIPQRLSGRRLCR